MTTPNVGQLVASTLRARKKEVADTVTNHNAILMRMSETGAIKEVLQGGRTILEPLIHGSNGSVQFYDGYESFTPPTTQDVIDAAEYSWKQLGGFVAISGQEMVQNSGKHAALDLLDTRVKHLKAQLKNTFAASLFSTGTGSGGKEFGGLQAAVADAPSSAGTYGGIDQVANPFWRNQVSTSAVFNAANALSRMNKLYLDCIRGIDKPDLIVADAEMFSQYEVTQQQLQRFTNEKLANQGFVNYKYKNADLVFDDNCPARHMYMLATSALSFRYAPNRWFEVGDSRTVTNADYEVVPIWTMGNLTTCNRALHGVIISSGIA